MTESDLILHTYTRRDAVDDGVLVDVTATARLAGFRIHVAVTAAVWAGCVAASPGGGARDERGRLWDILYVLAMAIRTGGESSTEIRYHLHVGSDLAGRLLVVALKAVCGPNDDGTPCVTVMLPEED